MSVTDKRGDLDHSPHLSLSNEPCPMIREPSDENGRSFQRPVANSVDTSLATSIASLYEAGSPDSVTANDYANQPPITQSKRAVDSLGPQPERTIKRGRTLFRLNQALESNYTANINQENSQLESLKYHPVKAELIATTLQYLEMMARFLHPSPQFHTLKTMPDTAAAMRLMTQLLQQRYESEIERIRRGQALAEDVI